MSNNTIKEFGKIKKDLQNSRKETEEFHENNAKMAVGEVIVLLIIFYLDWYLYKEKLFGVLIVITFLLALVVIYIYNKRKNETKSKILSKK